MVTKPQPFRKFDSLAEAFDAHGKPAGDRRARTRRRWRSRTIRTRSPTR